jgi:hypothetical protein
MVAERSADELSEAKGVGGTIRQHGQGPYLTKAAVSKKILRGAEKAFVSGVLAAAGL